MILNLFMIKIKAIAPNEKRIKPCLIFNSHSDFMQGFVSFWAGRTSTVSISMACFDGKRAHPNGNTI